MPATKKNAPFREKDKFWETLSQSRDKKGARFVSHEQAWV
jgi:hypothetical protein